MARESRGSTEAPDLVIAVIKVRFESGSRVVFPVNCESIFPVDRLKGARGREIDDVEGEERRKERG